MRTDSNKYIFQVYEHSWLNVGTINDFGIPFDLNHFNALAKYLTSNPNCGFYDIYLNRIKFKNYVGIIKVNKITIEVLPKIDNGDENKNLWQSVLIAMLKVTLSAKVKHTTFAEIETKKYRILDVYIQLFIEEVKLLLHHGLTKKYQLANSNENAIKGKLLINKHIIKNAAHAERFYLAHSKYSKDNIYNQIIFECLQLILSLRISHTITHQITLLLIDFPECNRKTITKTVFDKLKFDRQTERYKKSLELAKLIILNFHPDISGGRNYILAIMFDMNFLWESYLFFMLKYASINNECITSVKPQQRRRFWRLMNIREISLKPDILIETNKSENIVLDTKWKYSTKPSNEDIRQLYTYGKYFNSKNNYLIYPLVSTQSIEVLKGDYFDHTKQSQFDKMSGGLIYINIINKNALDKEIGTNLLKFLLSDAG